MKVHVCGVDIGKTVFHLVGLSKEGHIVTKKRFSRKQLLTVPDFSSYVPAVQRSLRSYASKLSQLLAGVVRRETSTIAAAQPKLQPPPIRLDTASY
jgi:hypothetical protein